MNHFGVLVMMLLLLAIATPALVANPASVSEANAHMALNAKTTPVPANAPTQISADHKVSTLPARPASRERTRRPARIDLSMPYYRFGRLPIRVKD